MMRRAVMSDLDKIMEIVKETVVEMNAYNNYQWDENYPKREDFTKDIERKELYVTEKDSIVTGFACINKVEPTEYKELNWALDEDSYVVHRIAIDMSYRKEGFGIKVMEFAEELAENNGVRYLKTDTYSLNTKAQRLFKKYGYHFVGEMNFLGKERSFYCYEKVLSK